MQALQEWNRGKPNHCVPRKGTAEHAEVVKLQNKYKTTASKSALDTATANKAAHDARKAAPVKDNKDDKEMFQLIQETGLLRLVKKFEFRGKSVQLPWTDTQANRDFMMRSIETLTFELFGRDFFPKQIPNKQRKVLNEWTKSLAYVKHKWTSPSLDRLKKNFVLRLTTHIKSMKKEIKK